MYVYMYIICIYTHIQYSAYMDFQTMLLVFSSKPLIYPANTLQSRCSWNSVPNLVQASCRGAAVDRATTIKI